MEHTTENPAARYRAHADKVRATNPRQAAMFERFADHADHADRAEKPSRVATARISDIANEITRLDALKREGRILAGLGIYDWDRKRGAYTAAKATHDLRALYASLTRDDMIALKNHMDA